MSSYWLSKLKDTAASLSSQAAVLQTQAAETAKQYMTYQKEDSASDESPEPSEVLDNDEAVDESTPANKNLKGTPQKESQP